MARKKKKHRRTNPSFLNGVATGKGESSMMGTAKETGIALAAGLVGGALGALFGKFSIIPGVIVTGVGLHKKLPWLAAGGIGLTMANGFQNTKAPAPTVSSTEGVDGIKEIAEQAKQRVGTFFENFKEKLFIPPSVPATTEGLGEGEQVTYFVNPYNSSGTGAIDMSELDRLEAKLDDMNKVTNGLDDVDREF